MDVEQRIRILVRLGEYMQSKDATFEAVKYKTQLENPWFIQEFINVAVTNIVHNFLAKKNLEEWVKNYNVNEDITKQKMVGIVMAGNIPLVGFHDLLCVFMSKNNALIKPSSKDEILIKHLVDKLGGWDQTIQNHITFATILKGCDAYIATGSNNSGRYFEYYFRKYPSIIRRNRTSIAIIDGTESSRELSLLADDMQIFFGLGCRNITKLYVPEGYDFLPLLEALKKYAHLIDFHKYKHNYDYQLALLIMNNKFYMNNGCVILTENKSPFSPVSQINFEFYTDKNKVMDELEGNSDIQCIVGRSFIAFGEAQSPQLTDYADGVDTMKFLCELYKD